MNGPHGLNYTDENVRMITGRKCSNVFYFVKIIRHFSKESSGRLTVLKALRFSLTNHGLRYALGAEALIGTNHTMYRSKLTLVTRSRSRDRLETMAALMLSASSSSRITSSLSHLPLLEEPVPASELTLFTISDFRR